MDNCSHNCKLVLMNDARKWFPSMPVSLNWFSIVHASFWPLIYLKNSQMNGNFDYLFLASH